MPATGQRFQHFLYSRRIARRDHFAIARRGQRVARPVAHPPAGAFDHRDERGEVVEFEACFDDEVEPALCQGGVIVAIATQHDGAHCRIEMLESVELRIIEQGG